MKKLQLAVLIAGLMVLPLLALDSQAAWPTRKPKGPDPAEQVRTYQPPPPEAMENYCEPYRKRASDLTLLPLWKKPFVIPQRNWAMHQHRKCVTELMRQEWEYLRHADIQKGPSLPKLRVEDAMPQPQPSEAPNAAQH